MPLSNYHLFAGRYDRGLMAPDANHFEIKLNTGGDFFRVAVNVRSQDGSMLMTYVDDNFQHELCARLLEAFPNNGTFNINDGPKRRQFGLDFLRRNMVGSFSRMVALPNNAPGLDNDLEDKLTLALDKSKADPNARIFVFGERWPGTNAKDKYFAEIKDQGIHDIHMNQGNPRGRFDRDNGVFQDGGILIHYPSLNRWTAILLAFQTQFNTLNPPTLHTDDQTGHRIASGSPVVDPTPPIDPIPPVVINTDVDNDMVIVAALVNPRGPEAGNEKVILLNTTEADISLDGWRLIDRTRQEFVIQGVTALATSAVEIRISADSNFNLGNRGGTISLLNPQGIKTSGVQYTRQQARAEGRLIHF